MQSFKKIAMKLYEELCSRGTHCLYVEDEKRLNVKKSDKNDLTIISIYILISYQKYMQSFITIGTKLSQELRSQEVPTVHILRAKMTKLIIWNK